MDSCALLVRVQYYSGASKVQDEEVFAQLYLVCLERM